MALGGVWIEPNNDSTNFVWQGKWPADIIRHIFSFTNAGVKTTNLYLELAALVLQESVFISTSASLA